MSLGRRIISTGAGDAVCLTESVQVFGADSTYSSNIATYKFDGNSNDETGNYNATAQGSPSYVTGKFGQAASLSNSDTDYFTTSISPTILGNSFSLSAWIYVTQDSVGSDYYSIAGAYWNGSSGQQSWIFYIDNGTLKFFSNLSSGNIYVGSNTVPLNTWTFVGFSVDDKNEISVYLNDQVETSSVSLSLRSNSINLTLGNLGTYSAGRTLYGLLDQVRVFNKALNNNDFATLYAETDSTTSNTNLLNEGAGVALYSFDYDASDTGGYYHGTPTNVDFGVGGNISFGARFNGSSSYIALSSNPINGLSNISISFWIKPDDVSSDQYLITFVNSDGGWNGFGIRISSSAKIQVVRANSGTVTTSENSTATLSTGSWKHIVVTSSQSELKIYIDGGLDSTHSIAGFTTNNTGEYNIGALKNSGSYSQFYDGVLDQVRVFSKVISSQDVETLYVETACVHTATTTDNDYPTTNLAYYKLDNSAEDEKGSYDGTESNIEYRFGKYGQAAVFNGTDSQIQINSFATLSQVGLSLWVNMPDVTAQGGLITKYPSSGNREFAIYIYGGDMIANLYYNGNNGNHITIDMTEIMSNNTWHHIAYSADGTNPPILWIDGVQRGTPLSSTNNSYTSTSEPILLGAFAANSAYAYDGKMDQVRIFASALTSSQVSQLYNEKPETDTSTFKTILYEGNNSTQYISNVGFQPDFVWVKSRDSSGYDHNLYDSVRGVLKRLKSQNNAIEDSNGKLTSFDANGFSLSAGGDANANGQSMVAWCWKGSNTDAVTNNVGDIPSQVNNSDKGFSIVKWSGSGANETVGHGLTVDGTATTPELIIAKRTNIAASWLASDDTIMGYLDGSDTFTSVRNDQYISSFTTTTIGLINRAGINATGDELIMYCFASASGVSKVGNYEGSNSTVTVSDVGFKPSFVMIKNVDDSGDWVMLDNRRNTIEDRLNNWLRANTSDQETGAVSTAYITVNDYGFIVANTTSLGTNANGDTYLYIAFK